MVEDADSDVVLRCCGHIHGRHILVGDVVRCLVGGCRCGVPTELLRLRGFVKPPEKPKKARVAAVGYGRAYVKRKEAAA